MKYLIFILSIFIITPFLANSQIQIGQDIDGEAIGDNFGNQVSMSSNGNIIALLGSNNVSDGSVRVFENVGGNWELYGTDSEGNHFGGMSAYSINLSNDGTTLAIGEGGGVHVYTYNSGIWMPKGSEIITNGGYSGTFGTQVNLSSDGNTIAITMDDGLISPSTSSKFIPPPIFIGIVQVFRFVNGNWHQIGNVITGNHLEYSGESISLSSDGSIVAISNRYSVRIFKNISEVWSIRGNEIIGSDDNTKSVSLSSDGNIVAMGDPDYSDTVTQRGRVGVYKFESNDWTQIGNDILGDQSQNYTGESISLSSDGQVVAVGEIGNNIPSTDSGRVRIFKNQANSWSQIGTSIFGEGSGDYSGRSISLSDDASTVAIGAPDNDGNGTDAGHVRVYNLSSTLSSNDFVLSKFSLFPNPTKNQFTIQLHEGLELQKVNIYNSLGQFIKSTNYTIIKTSELSTGIYSVEIVTNQGKATKKIVIK